MKTEELDGINEILLSNIGHKLWCKFAETDKCDCGIKVAEQAIKGLFGEVLGDYDDLEKRNEFLLNQSHDLNNVNFTLKEKLKEKINYRDYSDVEVDLIKENTRLREALERITGWLENESAEAVIGDGYDYNSGVEYGLRSATIESNKIAQDALQGKKLKPSRSDMGEEFSRLNKRMMDGHDYLMRVPFDMITASDALEAFGYNRDGME